MHSSHFWQELVVQSDDVWMIQIYADFSYTCQMFAEKWEKTAHGPFKGAVRMGRIDYGEDRAWAHSIASFDQVPFVFTWHQNRTSSREGAQAVLASRKLLAELVLDVVPWRVMEATLSFGSAAKRPDGIKSDPTRVTFVMLAKENSVANFLFHVVSPHLKRDAHLMEVMEKGATGKEYRQHIEALIPKVAQQKHQPLLLVYAGGADVPVVLPGPFTGESLLKTMKYHMHPNYAELHHHNVDRLCLQNPEPGKEVPICVGALGGVTKEGAYNDAMLSAVENLSQLIDSEVPVLDNTNFVAVSTRDVGMPLWKPAGILPNQGRIFAIRGGEDPGIAFHIISETTASQCKRCDGVEAFVMAAAGNQSSLDWSPIKLPLLLKEYEIPLETSYKKLLYTYVITPKTQVIFGLLLAVLVLSEIVSWYHQSKYGDKKVNMIRNIYIHWANAAPALVSYTEKAKEIKLNAERRAREGETLKQKRERIKREEEAGEEEYDAPPMVTEAFAFFDHDEDGAISVEDLAFVARAIGHEVDHTLFRELIESIDMDGTGEVSLAEFHRMTEAKLQKQRVEEIEDDY